MESLGATYKYFLASAAFFLYHFFNMAELVELKMLYFLNYLFDF